MTQPLSPSATALPVTSASVPPSMSTARVVWLIELAATSVDSVSTARTPHHRAAIRLPRTVAPIVPVSRTASSTSWKSQLSIRCDVPSSISTAQSQLMPENVDRDTTTRSTALATTPVSEQEMTRQSSEAISTWPSTVQPSRTAPGPASTAATFGSHTIAVAAAAHRAVLEVGVARRR